jgi:DNA recombination protein RmuC
MVLLVAMAVGVLLGCAIGWLWAATRTRTTLESAIRDAETQATAAIAETIAVRKELEARKQETEGLRAELREAQSASAALDARADEMRQRFDAQQRLLAEAERKLTDTFKSLAADALRATSDDLVRRADEKFAAERELAGKDFIARQKAVEDLLKPANDSLFKLDEELRRIENDRRESQGTLKMQLESLGAQTGKLADALKTPIVRGRWGEVQLRNVVEIAGMTDRCDFFEQESLATEDGRLRPDMVVRLPGGKNVVVDSKAPLKAYLEALDAADDSARILKLKEHAAQVRKHVDQLSSKAYWDACKPTPEFVVLFLPGEMFFSAALQQDAPLMEDAWARKVILATPTTLMAVLRSVAYTWRQEQLAENAQRISDLGQELHERIATMAGYLTDLGGALERAVREYNRTVSSMETRVAVSARKFRELGVASKREIGYLELVEIAPRELAAIAPRNGVGENGEHGSKG